MRTKRTRFLSIILLATRWSLALGLCILVSSVANTRRAKVSVVKMLPPMPYTSTISTAKKLELKGYYHDLVADMLQEAMIGTPASVGKPELSLQMEFDEARFALDTREFYERGLAAALESRELIKKENQDLLSEMAYVKLPEAPEEFPLSTAEAKIEEQSMPDLGSVRFGKLNIDLDFKNMREIAASEFAKMQERETYLQEQRPITLSMQVPEALPLRLTEFSYNLADYVAKMTISAALPFGAPDGVEAILKGKIAGHSELKRFFDANSANIINIIRLPGPAAAKPEVSLPQPPPQEKNPSLLGNFRADMVLPAIIIGLLLLLSAVLVSRGIGRLALARRGAAGDGSSPPNSAFSSDSWDGHRVIDLDQQPSSGTSDRLEDLVAHADDLLLAQIARAASDDELALLMAMMPVARSQAVISGAVSIDQLRAAIARLMMNREFTAAERLKLATDLRLAADSGQSNPELYQRLVLSFVATADLEDEDQVASLVPIDNVELRRAMLRTKVFLRDVKHVNKELLAGTLKDLGEYAGAEFVLVCDTTTRAALFAALRSNPGMERLCAKLLSATEATERDAGSLHATMLRRKAIITPVLALLTRKMAGQPHLIDELIANQRSWAREEGLESPPSALQEAS